MTRSAFERIPVSVKVETRYHEREIDKLRTFLTSEGSERHSYGQTDREGGAVDGAELKNASTPARTRASASRKPESTT